MFLQLRFELLEAEFLTRRTRSFQDGKRMEITCDPPTHNTTAPTSQRRSRKWAVIHTTAMKPLNTDYTKTGTDGFRP